MRDSVHPKRPRRLLSSVHLGFAVPSGAAVSIPVQHTIITGQTQRAGKTTTLEALIARSQMKGIAFVTKRGEGAFDEAHQVPPYFREQADWRFVASILEASRGEKLKFERAWIIRASKGARTLGDVQRNIRRELESPKTKGLNADVYLTLDAYLDVVVPQIDAIDWARRVQLAPGLNVMDLTPLALEMQHLVIRSTIEWVLEHEQRTIVVVPEAWKFIPEGRGTPVKLAAESYIRQGAVLGNYLWLDSQDIAGVEKLILKSVPVWVLGVQREYNEVKRTLAQIPKTIHKPKPEEIQQLGLGEFIVCHDDVVQKTYVQPAWMPADDAAAIARGEHTLDGAEDAPVAQDANTPEEQESMLTAREEQELRDRVTDLEKENAKLRNQLQDRVEPRLHRSVAHDRSTPVAAAVDEDALYRYVTARMAKEAPALLRLSTIKPELVVEVERRTITADGATLKGRVGKLIAKSFFREKRRHTDVKKELERTGPSVHGGNLSRELDEFVKLGFLTDETDGWLEVDGMKARIVEK